MFIQVITTFFDLMIDFEYFWKDTVKSRPSSIFRNMRCSLTNILKMISTMALDSSHFACSM